ncbi:MAG: HAD family hydrolase [Anaerolineales bacterium]|jgi:HAD superfamily hydrolase (TIGR01549 family)
MNFKAVLLDVGNTLLHIPEDPHIRSLKAVTHMGELLLEDYKAGIEQAKREWLQAGSTPDQEDLPETWISHNKRALELAEFEGDIVLAARLIEEAFLLDGWEVFSETHDVLKEIRNRGMRMGVVSNWPPTLAATLKVANIHQYFDVVVASGIVGYAKPHPEIYRFALKHLDVAPKQALFVGDNLIPDVKEPAAIGMPSVLVDRERRFVEHRERIDSLYELLDRLS